MKILSTVQLLLLAVKLEVSESNRFLATSVVPVVLTGALAYLFYSMFHGLVGSLLAIPASVLVAYPFYFLITLSSVNIYIGFLERGQHE